MHSISTTKLFEKDTIKLGKRGKHLVKLKLIVTELAKGLVLRPKHKDHKLTGNYSGFRKCHIEPDWLLIYKIENGTLFLTRTGTHSDLFS